jgi:putative transposase
MKRSRYSDEQIAYALRQAESGTAVADVCRQLRDQRGNVLHLEEEVRELGRHRAARAAAVAREELQAQAPGGGSDLGQTHPWGDCPKKSLRPARKRELVEWVRGAYGASLCRACRLVQISRSLHGYRSVRPNQEGLPRRMRDLAQAQPRFGYRRVHVLLRREGWPVNRQRVRPLYRLEGLQLRFRVRHRKHASLHRGIPPAASRAQVSPAQQGTNAVIRHIE